MYYFHFGEIVTVQVDVGLLIDLFKCAHDLGRNSHPHESLRLHIEFTARRNPVAEDTATKQTSESRQQKQSHQHDKNSLIRLLPMRERVESLKEQNVSVIILRWTSSSSYVTHSSLSVSLTVASVSCQLH